MKRMLFVVSLSLIVVSMFGQDAFINGQKQINKGLIYTMGGIGVSMISQLVYINYKEGVEPKKYDELEKLTTKYQTDLQNAGTNTTKINDITKEFNESTEDVRNKYDKKNPKSAVTAGICIGIAGIAYGIFAIIDGNSQIQKSKSLSKLQIRTSGKDVCLVYKF